MEVAKVGVLGCGLMGHGIAQICAQAGWDVVSVEIDQGALNKGMAKIEKQLGRPAANSESRLTDRRQRNGSRSSKCNIVVPNNRHIIWDLQSSSHKSL